MDGERKGGRTNGALKDSVVVIIDNSHYGFPILKLGKEMQINHHN
jgi:hypothetical protein